MPSAVRALEPKSSAQRLRIMFLGGQTAAAESGYPCHKHVMWTWLIKGSLEQDASHTGSMKCFHEPTLVGRESGPLFFGGKTAAKVRDPAGQKCTGCFIAGMHSARTGRVESLTRRACLKEIRTVAIHVPYRYWQY
ncbi:hypothetical protein PGTUg99_034042 [Puccinia graminis f. sp. tritici]|uniref:Uncharacterized protein n=1 Tax=Puccinia graminis f. sp. tritici TaxID=56615 RepID=A0A5B0RIG9_PUCGR|nr:hypothetical protein PGTUg99_034042 [Puccinia graminis f. sp. tritici]